MMNSHKSWAALWVGLFICMVSCALASDGQRSLLQEKLQLKIGVRAVANPPFRDCEDTDSCQGFDPDLAKAICEQIDADCEFEFLDTLEERITSLQDNITDFVMDSFSVTDERKERIDFVNPYYYAAGATLYVNENGADITGWDDIKGRDVCILSTYFVLESLREDHSPNFLEFDTNDERDAAFGAGDCVALVSDNVETGHGGEPVGEILFEEPFGIGIRKGNKMLDILLAGGLVQLMENGEDSILLQKESDDLVPAGITRLPELADVVKAITEFK